MPIKIGVEMTLQQTELDKHFMSIALEAAKEAEARGEVPVGAVLVREGLVIATGYNHNIGLNDPSAHAEMQCLREAGRMLGNYRLLDTTLYVTLEPCAMCAGVMVHSRIERLVFGAKDEKTGAAGSVVDLVRHPAFNHQIQVEEGVLAEECSGMLSDFFRRRRKEQKALKQAARDTQSASE